MNCPTQDLLRRHADGEVSAPEVELLNEHIRLCESCRERLGALRDQADRVRKALDALAPAGGEAAPDPASAYARLAANIASAAPEPPSRSSLVRRTPVWGSAAAACALIFLFSFAPARSWGQKFLSMLRVQQITVVPVDFQAAAQLSGGGNQKMIAQLISDNVVVTMKPGSPAAAASPLDATEMAGFPVRALDALGTPQRISVAGEAAFQMTVDHDRIQAVLDAAGRSDIQIPESANGSLVAVHIPKAVRMAYGNCPAPNTAPDPGQPATDCVHFIQIPSPAISVPPSLDLTTLAEAGLQIAGMSAAEAQAFCQTVDWTSTLVIPIPQNASSFQTVSVDGVNGTLVVASPRANSPGNYALIWVKNGIVYSVAGSGTGNAALTVAESLH